MKARRIARRDLPAVCAIFSAIFAFAAVAFFYAWRLDVVARDELRPITGQVEAVTRTNKPKAGPKLNIFVRTPERLVHLTQDDISSLVPRLHEISAGDRIVAMAKRDSLWRDLDWVWELKRGDDVVLSYEQTFAALMQRKERTRPLGYGAVGLALLLAAAALALRWHFGAWQRAT